MHSQSEPGQAESTLKLRVIALAVVLWGANLRPPVQMVGVVLAGLLLWGAATSRRRGRVPGSVLTWAVFAAALSTVGVFGSPIASFPPSVAVVRPILFGLVLVTAVIVHFRGHLRAWRLGAAVLAVVATLVTLAPMFAQDWSSTVGSDVLHAHLAAGQALRAGENPYTDVVSVVSTNPHHPPGTMIEGYSYPPVVLVTYGLAAGYTDPRLISALAWLGIVVCLAWLTLRSPREHVAIASLAVLLLLSFTPLVAEVWFMGWTEPLTLALFLGASLAWKKSWVWSGLVLGLALASKQYLVLLAPLLALHRDEDWVKRSVLAVGTAAITLVVGLVPNPEAFINATIGNLIDIGFRPDSQSIPGAVNALGWRFLLPTPVWVGLSLVMGGLIARQSRTRSDFLASGALMLAAAFLLGMAFPNYWFLVACLFAFAMVFGVKDDASPAVKGRS